MGKNTGRKTSLFSAPISSLKTVAGSLNRCVLRFLYSGVMRGCFLNQKLHQEIVFTVPHYAKLICVCKFCQTEQIAAPFRSWNAEQKVLKPFHHELWMLSESVHYILESCLKYHSDIELHLWYRPSTVRQLSILLLLPSWFLTVLSPQLPCFLKTCSGLLDMPSLPHQPSPISSCFLVSSQLLTPQPLFPQYLFSLK